MKYRVDVSGRARLDIGNIYAYQRENYSAGYAERWLAGLYHAMSTLDEMPYRCPVAREVRHAGGTVRHLLYRDFRVVYEVIGRRVHVLNVIHSSQPG